MPLLVTNQGPFAQANLNAAQRQNARNYVDNLQYAALTAGPGNIITQGQTL